MIYIADTISFTIPTINWSRDNSNSVEMKKAEEKKDTNVEDITPKNIMCEIENE